MPAPAWDLWDVLGHTVLRARGPSPLPPHAVRLLLRLGLAEPTGRCVYVRGALVPVYRETLVGSMCARWPIPEALAVYDRWREK